MNQFHEPIWGVRVGVYTKAIAAFLVLVVTNLVANLSDGGTPIPATQGEWVRLIATSALGALVVYAPRNTQTEKQVVKAVEKDLPAEAAERVAEAVIKPLSDKEIEGLIGRGRPNY